jgi:hypothetical protein
MIMKRLWTVLLLLPALGFGQDTVTVTPPRPTGQDWLTLQLYNTGHNCCTQYHNLRSSNADSAIYLSYEVENAVNGCDCIPGKWAAFNTTPLYPGRYNIYRVETPYCAQEPCPVYKIAPQLVGEFTVTGPTGPDTFTVRRSGKTCMTEPCPYLEVINQRTGDTTPVAAAQDTSGQYVCIFCKYMIPWLDEGLPVRGYFHTDSLAGWTQRDTVFAVTEVLASVRIQNPELLPAVSSSGFLVFPNPLSNRAVVSLDRNRGSWYFSLYNISGKTVIPWTRTAVRSKELDFGKFPQGVYVIKARAGTRLYNKRILIQR